jgi:phosphoribosylformylglycinamidine synthase
VGARIALQDVLDRDGVDLFTALFSESQGRAIVSVPRSEEIRFKDMCTARNFPHLRIGVVDAEGGTLEINGVETMSLEALREAHEATLPKYFG